MSILICLTSDLYSRSLQNINCALSIVNCQILTLLSYETVIIVCPSLGTLDTARSRTRASCAAMVSTTRSDAMDHTNTAPPSSLLAITYFSDGCHIALGWLYGPALWP